MSNRIRYRHLQCFLTIVQLRSVAAAADALAVTQPALSKTLRELEDELGVKLFSREKTGMRPTRFGDLFLNHAATSMASLRKGIDEIGLARNTGQFGLSIGMMPNVADRLLPKAVRAFEEAMPGTAVHIVTGTNSSLLDQVRLGTIEFVVGRLAQPEYMVGLSFEHLYAERLSLVTRPGHPLARQRKLRLKSISDFPWLLPPHGSIMRLEIDRFLLSHGISERGKVVETMSVSFGRGYVRETDAVWFVPTGAVQSDIEERKVVVLSLSRSAMQGSVGITTKQNAVFGPPAARMLQAIRDVARHN